MRNLPRFALVPLAVLISAVPLLGLVSPAGADTASGCDSAFTAAPATGLSYATDPPERLAWTGQTVRLSAGWDPAAWDSLSSALACVQVDDVRDDGLGAAEAAPDNSGAFDHSFTIPEVAAGTRLCTRIRLAGDPAGEATEAVWVSKTHCYEVDHEDEAPPADDTAPPAGQPPANEQPPAGDQSPAPDQSSTPAASTSAPVAGPANAANAAGTPGDSPAADTPAADTAAGPEGNGGPAGTPFDSAAAPPPAAGGEVIPLLPATGYASLRLLHHGELLLGLGTALLLLARRPHRQPSPIPSRRRTH